MSGSLCDRERNFMTPIGSERFGGVHSYTYGSASRSYIISSTGDVSSFGNNSLYDPFRMAKLGTSPRRPVKATLDTGSRLSSSVTATRSSYWALVLVRSMYRRRLEPSDRSRCAAPK